MCSVSILFFLFSLKCWLRKSEKQNQNGEFDEVHINTDSDSSTGSLDIDRS